MQNGKYKNWGRNQKHQKGEKNKCKTTVFLQKKYGTRRQSNGSFHKSRNSVYAFNQNVRKRTNQIV